ncbi:MAG TPA: tetratricopeptide repeat protein [Candidatus Obscuribacter sp.]|nr:tetratricopeptide repeat protein [Candidatus Obscuribacter sp.]HNM49844.1 tetratricopeptide repeat protein [Candidatus Obscuribacter sp.]
MSRRNLKLSLVFLLLPAAASLVAGCTYLGKGGNAESSKLDFDLRDIGIKKNVDSGPMETPPPEKANDIEAWAFLANNYEQLENYDYAEKCFRKCVELKPLKKIYWHALGQNQKHQEKLEGAREAFIQAVPLDVNDVFGLVTLAEVDQHMAKVGEARYYYIWALSIRPDFPEAWKGLHSIAHNLAEDRYLPQLEKLRANPTEAFNRLLANEMVDAYLSSHDDKDPFYYGYRVTRGYLQMLAMNMDVAEADFKTVIEKKPESTEALRAKVGLISLYTTVGRDQEAKTLIAEVMKLSPDQPDVWYNQALVERRAGAVKPALDSLGKATSLAPDHTGWSKLFEDWLFEERRQRKEEKT